MTLSDYSYLLQQIEYNVGVRDNHRELLDNLKYRFKNDINSPRRFEQIKSIGDLLKILELRDVLSNESVDALQLIAEKLGSTELLKQINGYKCSHKSHGTRHYNYYVSSQSQGCCPEKYKFNQKNIRINNPCHENSVCKKDRIMETIKEEIGTSWRDLGRNLKIREGEIEDIDIEYTTLFSKASKLLEVYEKKKSDPDRWFFTLCEALEKSRRKDLSKSIQDIMMMNI